MESVKPPLGWRSYIEQFAPFDEIKAERGNQALARYLINKFGFEYETSEQMEHGLDKDEVKALTDRIVEVRENTCRANHDKATILAYNDALQALRIFEYRRAMSETSPANPFGFKTWWLTQDAKLRRATGKLVADHHGQRFMMRPEFLLNYILLSPSAKEVKESFKKIFPTALGIRLANRLHVDVFRDVMKEANEVWAVDEARASAMITDLGNTLKGDQIKVYDQQWNSTI